MNPRILIVDDHEIVREGIRTLINRARPNWEICGEATNGKEAIAAVQSLQPDLVVLDITMPGLSGLEATQTLVKSELETKILMFTMHESARLANDVREAGAHGLVLKSQASRDLILAIETLLAGGTFFPNRPETNGPPPSTRFSPGTLMLRALVLKPAF
jgi:DNA-binding NarL/FixJ family response regulator